jgi:hypothetical protein
MIDRWASSVHLSKIIAYLKRRSSSARNVRKVNRVARVSHHVTHIACVCIDASFKPAWNKADLFRRPLYLDRVSSKCLGVKAAGEVTVSRRRKLIVADWTTVEPVLMYVDIW